MTIKKLIIISMIALSAAACGGGTSGDGGNNEIRFTILLSANCATRFSTADIFFDDVRIATLTPGGSTSVSTTPGEHRIEAVGSDGSRVGPITRNIQSDGGSETFTCDA